MLPPSRGERGGEKGARNTHPGLLLSPRSPLPARRPRHHRDGAAGAHFRRGVSPAFLRRPPGGRTAGAARACACAASAAAAAAFLPPPPGGGGASGPGAHGGGGSAASAPLPGAAGEGAAAGAALGAAAAPGPLHRGHAGGDPGTARPMVRGREEEGRGRERKSPQAPLGSPGAGSGSSCPAGLLLRAGVPARASSRAPSRPLFPLSAPAQSAGPRPDQARQLLRDVETRGRRALAVFVLCLRDTGQEGLAELLSDGRRPEGEDPGAHRPPPEAHRPPPAMETPCEAQPGRPGKRGRECRVWPPPPPAAPLRVVLVLRPSAK